LDANPRLAINPDGNVSIGVTNPVEKLDVDGKIKLRDEGVNWGNLMVEFNTGNYYAVYVP